MEWAELGITWSDVGLVVVAGLGMYLFVVLVVRLIGPRSLGSFSAFDLVVTIAMGSIIGRVVLVRTSLAAGVVGLATLFAAQSIARLLRHRTLLSRLIDHPPVLLVRSGVLVDNGLRRAGLERRDIYEQLRLAGLADLADVEAAVLERDGSVSIVGSGATVSAEVFSDVPGWQRYGDDEGALTGRR